uniref:Uncharacterized protein LOC111102708 isoform X2 n=1 Tax=Crassostrea virginica TaxID=6565 RepID=A0A8B8AL02_CRAVI|nr:uncharacterized protein LOC111102708 isoform X2 [Crassostrea virginica]
MISLSVIVCSIVQLTSSASCPQSIPTVSVVPRCPSNEKEWISAAGKKNCSALEKYQNCSKDRSFVYHCVLKKNATELMEVCAPIWYMSGFCARFSMTDRRIIDDPALDCTKFVPPCPTRFPSNESFKYQMCYSHIKLPTASQSEKINWTKNNNSSKPRCEKKENIDELDELIIETKDNSKGKTIETCLKLAGKEPDRLPSQSTIAIMNILRLCLGKKQLEEKLPGKKNTTLHTNETSKFGVKYGGFSLRDEEGAYFVLGLREMATKSAQSTLDTFKDILDDISFANKETLDIRGIQILCNIQNTMSDRAATELKFNEILQDYRMTLLPQLHEDFNNLDDAGKEAVSRLNNFFCGLHGLLHMTNASQKELCEAER